VNKLRTTSANDAAFRHSRLRRILRKSVLTWFWVQNEIKRFKTFVHVNCLGPFMKNNFITGNLHCILTQRRLCTKVGKKIQNPSAATKVVSDFIVKEIEKQSA
jgi:hypothetical protein